MTKNYPLSSVDKPLRYIDHEVNAFHREFEKYPVRFCFIYPDVYEIGISHLGIKILYSIINKTDDAMADRAYTPWPDYGGQLQKENIALYGIESKRPLKDFDCLGFTLQTELIYTNILYTLDLAQIPLKNTDRTAVDPIIMAGGINAVNPHPLSLFIDVFFIGEAEEGILQIKKIFAQTKDRDERLRLLNKLEYLYLPRYSQDSSEGIHSEGRLNGGDAVATFSPPPPPPHLLRGMEGAIQGLKYSGFADSEDTHFPQLVPLLEGTHNRYTAEIMRGCTRGCRFCQAGMFYRPVREKDPVIITKQLLEDTKNSGWDSAGLLSLSSTDYSCIKELLQVLINRLQGTGTALSLPSLRIDSLDTDLVELINYLKKSGITLAIEAGTQRLRDIINKNLTEEEILNAVRYSYEAGARLVKLYFMIGLPFETEEDIDGIISLVEKIAVSTSRKMRINISISPFVPKPMTPFQWAKMGTEREVLDKALKIKHALIRYKFIKVNYHTIEISFLEAVLSRGCSATARVIEQAYKKGAKFDAWREYFDYNIWQKAAEEVRYDWYKPVRGFEPDEALPWDNIDIGISKTFLLNEYQKAQEAITTPDCRKYPCTACGACTGKKDNEKWKMGNGERKMENDVTHLNENITHPPVLPPHSLEPPVLPPHSWDPQVLPPHSWGGQGGELYRISFSKTNDLKYLSHLDFLRLIHRLLMHSHLPIMFSQGYNPHPKTAFAPPLSSGIEGENEFFDIWLSDHVEPYIVLSELSKTTIMDLNFTEAINLFENNHYKKDYIPISHFDQEIIEILFSEEDITPYIHKVNLYLANNDTIYTKIKKEKEVSIDLQVIIHDIRFSENKLLITKKIQGASIYDILHKIFDINRENAGCFRITRKKLCEGK